MEPITFKPVYMKRVWGGRELEKFYGRQLPTDTEPFGESWEIVDRPEAQSVVNHGLHSGKTLHDLWQNYRDEIFGEGYSQHGRFPILIKILDARDDLSIQVHPPKSVASELGGEPKCEMWYIADCKPEAKLYVGLKAGVDRSTFEKAIHDGSVAECVHAITPDPGDSIFIPSGRIHAIGAGFLIHEIQQNSDTTYRVFDWNRTGLDGSPRELHNNSSLASINFNDIEPSMHNRADPVLADRPIFKVERLSINAGETALQPDTDKFSIIILLEGALECASGSTYQKGQHILIPRDGMIPQATSATKLLHVTLPSGK